jgi:ribosome biogenesis GTPase
VHHRLASLGFSSFFESAFVTHAADGLEPARVAVEHRSEYVLCTEAGELHAELAGRLRHESVVREARPVVGDWVAFRPTPDGARAVIHAVLPRRAAFVRGAAGTTTEAQVVAANVDVVFLLCATGADFNPRRVERYLTLARSSGAEPVLVLTKVDLADPLDASLAELHALAGGAPVHAVSSVTGEGVSALGRYLPIGTTVALLGSSGAGKSTLANRLAGGERLATGQLGVDGRGMHTTTRRELVVLPDGGVLLDTPGMRELRLWDAEEGLERTFVEVTDAARDCRFGDCAHDGEPGCAVREALERGDIDPERWASYVKLERELAVEAIVRNRGIAIVASAG